MTFQSLSTLVPTLIEPLNSTTIPLIANATFTGIFSNLIAFPVVDVVVLTDQPGTLFLDVSSDGVTVSQTTSFAVTSTLLFRSPFSWQYVRLRYTNGATAQTTFFLQCILRPSDPGLASLPLNRTISTNSIAPLNRAVLNAQAPSGFFQNLQCDSSNILLVNVSNFPSIQPVSGTVTSNIGTTNGLALDSSINGILLSQGSTTSGEKGILHMGAVTTSNPTYITAQTSPLSLTTGGRLRVDLDGSSSDGPVIPGTVALYSSLAGGQFNSTAPTLTNTQQAALQLDASGNLLVNITTTTASSSTPSATTISAYVSANKAYVTAFNVNMPSAGTDNPLLYLRNPTGSGKTLYIYKTGFGSTVANVSAIFRVFTDPTVSANGTSQSIFSLNIGGGAGASSMLVTSTPTVSANGSNIETVNVGQNSNSLSFVEDFSIHIAANHSILITGNPLSNNRNAELTIVWVEI